MSDLFKKSLKAAPPSSSISSLPARPRPDPISVQDTDEPHPPSDSSSSSADSEASVASANTIRPGSRDQPIPDAHWSNYFAEELHLTTQDDNQLFHFHVYLTRPTDPQKDPLFICHHGAGSSGLSFAVFAKHIRQCLPRAGILSLEARGHGGSSTPTKLETYEPVIDYSIQALASDAHRVILMTQSNCQWRSLPPIILVGHSLGGAVVAELAANNTLGSSLLGFAVLDVVEGSALEALSHMKTYLASRPRSFKTIDEAITWHTRTRTIRCLECAQVSVPSLLQQNSTSPLTQDLIVTAGQHCDEGYTWRTDLSSTSPWWESWFTGMSSKFLRGRGGKMLILAGTDRLDKELMIGQMQGKFQLVVLPEAGHFVQEDVPERTAELLVEFFRRNDRSALVLPPKVSELLAQGKKV